MIRPARTHWLVVGVLLACWPALAGAQARSLDDLRRILTADDVVIVTDRAGQEVVGKVVEATASSLVLVTLRRDERPDHSIAWATGDRRAFTEDTLAAVRRSDLSARRSEWIYRAPWSFTGLNLRAGQRLIVTDATGVRTRGTLDSVSPFEIVLAIGDLRKTFGPAGVTSIKRPGPIWDGAVKGAAVAALITTLAGGTSYPEVYPGTMLWGAGIGLAIDAAFGPATIYKAPSQRRTLTLAPIVGRDQRGFAATIRF